MKKKLIAVRGRIFYCILPLLLLITAVYLFTDASFPVSSGGGTPAFSVYDIIVKMLEG